MMRLGKHGQTSALAGDRDGCQYYFTFFKYLSRKTYLDLGLYYMGRQPSCLIRLLTRVSQSQTALSCLTSYRQLRGRQNKRSHPSVQKHSVRADR